jgi:hypothetical protein
MKKQTAGRNRSWRLVLAVAVNLVLASLAITSFAQAPTGVILGTVQDASHSAIPGAIVTVTDTETGLTRTSSTSDDGSFRFPSLPVGPYSVGVKKQGFAEETREHITLTVSQEVVLNFALEVGAQTQQVVVQAEAPQVDTTNSTLGGLVNEQKIDDLPLNGRNYIDLTLLQPGVSHSGLAGSINSTTTGTWFSSSGAPVRSNNITLDGARLNNYQGATSASPGGNTLGIDGIREYRVITDMFGAEYGLTMGSQVVMVSRSGTNKFHGDAFDYLRNDKLDANNYFSKFKPPHKRNDFGGAFGGPIKRDKAFFYGVYEGIREIVTPSARVNVLSTNCYDLNHQLLLTNNPCAVTPTNPSGDVAPFMQKLVSLFPYPNSGTHQYIPFPYANRNGENFGQVRYDQNITSADSFFARYTTDSYNATNNSIFPVYNVLSSGRNNFITLSETHIFRADLVNTARISFSRTASNGGNYVVAGPSDCPTLACPGYSFLSVGARPLPTGAMVVGNTNFGPTAGNVAGHVQNIYTFSDDLFYTKGRHALKFGILFNRFNVADQGAPSGNVAGETIWNSFTDLLNGTPALWDADFTTPETGVDFIFNTMGVYAQDDFRATSRLTLNLGLRYEFNTTPWELNGRQYTHLNIQSDPLVAAQHPILQNDSYKNISPRMGFAYDVFGNGTTAIRGGFGEYFDVGNIGTAIAQYNYALPPLSSYVNIPVGPGAPAFSIPFPTNIPGQFQLIHTLDYYSKQPHVLQYNLSLDRQLPANLALSVSYVGSRGINLFRVAEQNPNRPVVDPTNAFPGQPFWGTDPTVPQGRFNPNFGSATMVTTGSSSWYNALQVGLTMRPYHGLEAQAAYTHSRSLDTTQGQQYVFDCFSASGSASGINPFNANFDKGPSCFDLPNDLRLNFLYHFPKIKSGGVLGKIANGWWIGSIISAQSGYPFNVNTVGLMSNSGVFGADQGERPNVVTAVNLAAARAVDPQAIIYNRHTAIIGDPNGWFNPHMFTLMGPKATAPCNDSNPGAGIGTLYGDTVHYNPDCYFGYLGDEPRDDLRGPNLRNWDLSINKDTALPFLGEAGEIEFRAEMFNFLNHPNFGMPNNTVFAASDPSTGGAGSNEAPPDALGNTNVVGSLPNRQIQLSLKIIF